MICSQARVLANQANSKKSTGPRTAEGKARSRCNAFKHGLTGEGVALPHEDAVEVARRFTDLRLQFHPATPMGAIMVHRVAFLSVRLERCAEQEAAHLGTKIRHATDAFDDQRQTEVAKLFDDLADAPATCVRRLLRTPEGVEALIQNWLDLKADLGRFQNNPRFWTAAHCERANLLFGRTMDEVPVSRINELSNAIWGDFGLIGPSEGVGLAEKDRQAWARERLVELIDEEVATLRICFEGLDHEGFEIDREEAPRRAMFDPSKEASLARRYEAAAERGMFAALRQLRKVESEAAADPKSPTSYPDRPLALIGSEPVASTEGEGRSRLTPRSRPVDVLGLPCDEVMPGDEDVAGVEFQAIHSQSYAKVIG